MHGHELQIGLRPDERKGIGEAELQPHQPRQHQCHQADRDRREGVLDCDDLGVLGEDVLGYPTLRMIELHLRHFGRCDLVSWCRYEISHSTTLFAYSVRSEEHTSELQSLMRISYAVF